jgi:hypothetical protein
MCRITILRRLLAQSLKIAKAPTDQLPKLSNRWQKSQKNGSPPEMNCFSFMYFNDASLTYA